MSQELKSDVKCPLCGSEVEAGYVPDYSYAAILQTNWAQGEPKPAFLGGIKRPKGAQFRLEAFRCMACGYVMWFARTRVSE